MAPNTLKVRVSTNSTIIDFKVNSKIKPRDLFEQIAHTLGLRETWYFGLRHKISNTGEYRWVNMDKKILKQGIKIEAPDKMDLELRFKYYPEDIEKNLIQNVTIKLFFLQLKQDILNGDTYCPAELAVALASYVLQYQYGDYDPDIHIPGKFSTGRSLPAEVIQKHNISDEEWDAKIFDFYKDLQGMDKEEAMIEYCKGVEGLDAYGITYFNITNSKSTKMLLGVNALGINIYEENNKLNPKFSFPWSQIKKLKKSHGIFKVKLEKIDFVAKSLEAREIHDLCAGTHEMYKKFRKPESLEEQQMRNQKEEEQKARHSEREQILKEIRLRQKSEEERNRILNEFNDMNDRNKIIENELIEARIKIEELSALLQETEGAKEELEIELERLRAMLNSQSKEFDPQLLLKIEKQKEEVNKLKAIIETKEDQTECLREEIDYLQNKEVVARMSQSSSSSSSSEHNDIKEKASITIEPGTINDEPEFTNIETTITNGEPEFTYTEKTVINGETDINDMETSLPVEEEPVIFSSTSQSAEEKIINLNKSAMMKELQFRLNETKNVAFETIEDKIHRENIRQGRHKFITLRQIRFGTIKRKIEEFEGL